MPELPPNWEMAEKLSREHRPDARRTAARILGSPTDPELDDVIHEADIKAAQKFHTLREPHHARGWYLTIVSRQALDLRRARRRRGDRESPVGSVGDLEKLYAAAGGISSRDFSMLDDALEFMNTLPEKQRTAYLLEHFIGLGREHIAQVLECSQKTVSTHLRRAQAKVDKKFSPAVDLVRKKQQDQSRRSTV